MNTYQKNMATLTTLLMIVAMALNACTSLAFGQTQASPTPLPIVVEDDALTAEGHLMPLRSTALGFVASGELGEIQVSEGQEVEKGDLLASLGERKTLEATLSQARLEQISAQQALDDLNESAVLMKNQSAQGLVVAQKALIDARQALNQLDTEAFRDELDTRNDTIQDKKDELDDAQDQLDKYQDLDPENSTRKDAQKEYDDALRIYNDAVYARDTWLNRLDQAEVAVNLAQAQLDEAQRVSNAHQDGPDADDLALAQARLDNANAQVAAAENALEKVELIAPYDAVVVEVNDLEPGEYITPGIMVVILADYSEWLVETTDLSELDVVNVEVGRKVSVTPDAMPDLRLEGVVKSIDLVPTERSGDILYTIHIRMEEVDPQFRWGMTVTVTF